MDNFAKEKFDYNVDLVLRKYNEANRIENNRYQYQGHTFEVFRDVFPPTHFQSTGIFTKAIEYPVGGSFMEMGCGSGVTSVYAALTGCSFVVASDISEQATLNTLRNVEINNVADIVSVRQGDLFEVVNLEEKFDMIYWNSNFIYVDEGFHGVGKEFADAGYRTHRKFFEEVGLYVKNEGKIILGFSDAGSVDRLTKLAKEYDYVLNCVFSERGVGSGASTYFLFEATKTI